MILNSTLDNQAVLSNVGTVNSFSIKATAKSFKILSDGLYANKVKAIIRELSCNAYDSHVAAGKKDVPFEVHLPTSLEPWFYVRDFGVGLSNQEVTNIFTTFFESTKTGSNDFVGALGLGSKSPFSYTDNFTVTSVKNNRKGVYSAFINEHGVPSIALMVEEDTSDDPGVEIKFSVNEKNDYRNFEVEAKSVFTYFQVKPLITGNKITLDLEPKYKTKNIISGVHQCEVNVSGGKSVAIMGNIAYPIELNDKLNQKLGNLSSLLNCNLIINFEIGELDFQASREGLSYVDMTINNIHSKLVQLNNQLSIHITTEANKLTNEWERAIYLKQQVQDNMWANAVIKYVKDSNFDMVKGQYSSFDFIKPIEVDDTELKSKYNISLSGFVTYSYQKSATNIKTKTYYNKGVVSDPFWEFIIEKNKSFVINDTKVGTLERSKFHWKTNGNTNTTQTVYVLNAQDKTKPMDTEGFFKLIRNPPKSSVVLASSLDQKARKAGVGKNVNILKLSKTSGWRDENLVWRDAGLLSSLDKTKKYYYVPLSGFSSLGKISDIKKLHSLLEQTSLFDLTIYGVRKGDMEAIKNEPNWVNIDDHVLSVLTEFEKNSLMPLAKSSIDFDSVFKYNSVDVSNNLSAKSPYREFFELFAKVKPVDHRVKNVILQLYKMYKINETNSSNLAYVAKMKEIKKRYPLLEYISYCPSNIAFDYIKLVDKTS